MMIKMKMKFCLLLLFFIISFFALRSSPIDAASNNKNAYTIKPWAVGQYVIYQIITMENSDKENRYKISIIGEEALGDKKYFWVQIDIYELNISHGFNTIEKEMLKNISLKALMSSVTSEQFYAQPDKFLAQGIFPGQAKELYVQIYEGSWTKVDPLEYFTHQHIIEDTPYSSTPDAMGRIDFSRLNVSKDQVPIITPAGEFACYHFFVDTGPELDYTDEGIILYRNAQVPILGIVRMIFSDTQYWDKWNYSEQEKKKTIWKDFFKNIYTRRIPGRRRSDEHKMILVDYGYET